MTRPLPSVRVWNRETSQEEEEQLFNGETLFRLYHTWSGRLLNRWMLTRRPFNVLYGALQDRYDSREKIAEFVQRFDIRVSDFEDCDYKSFNEFFIRKFRAGARTFCETPGRMPAFTEARYLGYSSVDENPGFPVKGAVMDLSGLLGPDGQKWLPTFACGPLLVARLAPIDYHRFHFPDAGRVLEHVRVRGPLHSVHPLALVKKPNVLWTNERRLTVLETEHFGKLLYVEVGAITVGKIVQTHGDRAFSRGDEKGYFQFGASTVVVVGELQRWRPDADILAQTAQGRETLVRLGSPIAREISAP